jgi:hypothetical protein
LSTEISRQDAKAQRHNKKLRKNQDIAVQTIEFSVEGLVQKGGFV